MIYNLHRAQSEAAGRVVMVEGYMDVIAAHSSGVRAIVALSGTSLSKRQAKQIKSVASDVVLNMDADEAGRKAVDKHVATLHGEGLRVRVAEVTGDPDSFIRTNGGEAYRERIGGVRPLIEWLSARAREHCDVSTAEAKADALRWILERLESVPETQREQISKEVSRYWNVKAPDVEKPKHAEHIAAWDWTLAPHKSYSATALIGGDKGLIGDHKQAVRVALGTLERNTRKRS